MAVVSANGAPLSDAGTKVRFATPDHAANALETSALKAPAPYLASIAVRIGLNLLVLPATKGSVTCALLNSAPSLM
jgi:hypothetical protein